MIFLYLITIAGGAATLVAGMYVYSLQRRMKVNRVYLLLSLLVVFFTVCELLLFSTSDKSAAVLLSKMLSVEFLIYPIVLSLVLFLRMERSKSLLPGIFLFGSALVFIVLAFLSGGIEGVPVLNGVGNLRFQNWNSISFVAFLWEMGILSAVLVNLFIYERRSKDRNRKGLAIFLFLSVGIMFLSGMVTQLIMTGLDMPVNFVKAIGFSIATLCIVPAVGRCHLYALSDEYTARRIITGTSELIMYLDAGGCILDFNPALLRLTAMDHGDVTGVSLDRLAGREVFAELMTLLVEKGSVTLEIELHPPGTGGRHVEFRASLIADNDGLAAGVLLIGSDRTQERKTAFRLMDRERRFRMLLNSTDDMILVYPIDMETPGSFLEINNVACEILGYTKEEWDRMTIFDVIDDREAGAEHLHRLFRDRKNLRELGFKTRNGRAIPFEINSRAIEMDGMMMVISIARDITERRITRDMIHVMESAIDASMSAIFFTDLDGTITWVNESFMRLWGVSDDNTVVGRSVSGFVVGSDRFLNDIKASGSFIGELNALDVGRPGFTIQITAHSFRHASGDNIGIMASCIDVTDARKAEQALRDSKRNYQTLVEKSRIAIAVENSLGKPIFFNERFPEIFGREAHELNELGIPAVIGLANESRPEKDPVNIDLETLSSSGAELFLNADILPVREDGKLRGWRYYIRDDTDRRLMERELQRNEKLESIGILAGGIAHDFNNVLTAITGNLGLARLTLERGENPAPDIEETERQTLRAKQLTEQLLTFARGGAPVKKDASIRETVLETVRFALSGSGVKPVFYFEEKLPNISFDPGQFSQVMSNLALNARDAMKGKGIFTVDVKKLRLDGQNHLSLDKGDYLEIACSDQGPGIPEEVRDRIFEPYFTTKDYGNGLGLATSFSIVKRHGGHIQVESEPDIGTIFRIYMPVVTVSGYTEQPEEKPSLSIGHGRVLVMDDDRYIRDIAENLLTQLGYDVITCDNGEDAVKAYTEALEQGNSFDLCIFDLTIPGGMGGREALSRLMEIDSSVKAIVSSGYSNDPIMSDYSSYGFSDVVVKPYRIEQLAQTVKKLMANETD